MSRTIQIRDVPDDVHRTLRARAAAAGQSLSEYMLGLAVDQAKLPPVAEVLQRAAMDPGGATTEQIVAAVRAGRDGIDNH